MSLDGWDDLTEEERNERMDEFVEALRGKAAAPPAKKAAITRRTKPKGRA